MISRVHVARHPLHPILVVVPVGLWVFSFVCDLVSLVSSSPVWSTVALYTMGAGIAGALMARVPGFVDLLAMSPSRARSLGIYHMGVNLAALLLYAVDFTLRYS